MYDGVLPAEKGKFANDVLNRRTASEPPGRTATCHGGLALADFFCR